MNVTLRAEHRVKVFQNEVPREILGAEDEVRRRLRYAGHIAG